MTYSNNHVNGVSDYALLAKLAYKKLAYKKLVDFDDGGANFKSQIRAADNIFKEGQWNLFNSYFSEDLVQYVGDTFSLVKTFDDPNTGFFAALLRDQSGQYTLAIRGTEFENDAPRDLLATDVMIGNYGIALPQVASLREALDEIASDPKSALINPLI